MATPLRKDQPREELSTADLAQGRTQNRPEPGDPKPVASERVFCRCKQGAADPRPA